MAKALAEFHQAVKAEPQNNQQLKKTYDELQRAFEAFWRFLELEQKLQD